MTQYLVLISVVCAVFGIGAYIKDTISGRARPNKISWLMWAVAPLIATAAAISKGVTWAVLPVFLSGFGPLCVFVVSLFSKKAYWKLKPFDYICGVCSVLALILWAVTKEANIAIILAIASDGFAAVPTLKKAWTNPETESPMPFIAGFIGATTSFAAVRYWVFPEYAFATYLVVVDLLLILAIYNKKIFKRH